MTPADLHIRRHALPSGMHLELAERGPPEGRPVMFLHGITDSWRSFEQVLPRLPRAWRSIAVSQRGHGRSDKPAGAYRSSDFAGDIAALIESLGLGPTLLVGHSLGATNAIQVACEHPELVCGLVLVAGFASFADKPELVAYVRDAIEPLRDPVAHAFADDFQRSTLAQAVPEAFLALMVEQSLQVPAHVWREAFAGALEHDTLDAARRVVAPTLLLHGELDAYVPTQDLHRLQAAIPGARREIWAGGGHALHWERPTRFAAALEGFEAQLRRPVRATPAETNETRGNRQPQRR